MVCLDVQGEGSGICGSADSFSARGRSVEQSRIIGQHVNIQSLVLLERGPRADCYMSDSVTSIRPVH